MLNSSVEKLNAITWKCDQLNMTYGQFISTCSERDLLIVYQEYEVVLAERKAKEKAWIAQAGKKDD